ncbi:synthetase [Moumouvirus goulette]|uniref:arginine--tRNA ligase n=1 Tax=Moumouvirus goulette TaxID=1247379 RepID=M1PAX3_9VIRU|nr:synthetase [Moumouvirus goulette]AGF85004.1 synthetase [Moumouvirus goulette]
MENITQLVNNYLRGCISSCFPQVINVNEYSVIKSNKHDYQFNRLAHLSQITSLNINIVADKLLAELSNNKIFDLVQIINIKQNIFLVLNISNEYISRRINIIYDDLLHNSSLPNPIINSLPPKILIDFSSPNIAKEMHIGHLRSTIIGESLCRIYEFCGCEVQRVNHIGDWGTQFGMLIAYIKKYDKKIGTLSELMNMYKESRKLFDEDNEFHKNSLQETVKLQKGDEENICIWKEIREISLTSFNEIYKELDTYSEIKGESFYQSRMNDLIKELDGFIVEDNRMKIIRLDNYECPLILVKSDGGFTYDTSDLAALKYRLFEEKADQILYVVDSGQSLHFNMIFETAIKFGWCSSSQVKHIGFGVILGEDGRRLKTRSGKTIKLLDVLNDVKLHAKTITSQYCENTNRTMSPDMIETISNKIAVNSIKYSDLNNPRENNYKFDIKKMLNTKGNTAVYLMYALARCQGILRKTPNLQDILNGQIVIDDLEIRNLSMKILKYPEVIESTIKENAPHHICNYLYELVVSMTKFYNENRCMEIKNDQIIKVYEYRIRLINLVVIVIKKMFDLIGLEHVEQI